MKKKMKRAIMLMMAGITCVSTLGCSGNTIEISEQQKEDRKEINTTTGNTQNDIANSGVGRYVEKVVFETDYFGDNTVRLEKMEDGSLVYFDTFSKYISTDNGETWIQEELDWLHDVNNDYYFVDSAIAKDGSILLGAMPLSEDENMFLGEGEKIRHIFIGPDKIRNMLDTDLEGYSMDYIFADDGRLFASMDDENIYEIDKESGKTTTFLQVGDVTYKMQCQNSTMLCAGLEEIYLFDMDSKERIQDSVLTEFVKNNYGSVFSGMAQYHNYYAFFGEENVVYIAGSKGLYRHIIGGSSMEQIIAGNLSAFGDPSHGVVTVQMIENQEFLVCFSDNKLMKFTYDATIPTVPSNCLKVYSLMDNEAIRQAISTYQAENPDSYVEYEIGMNGDGVTREDALKNLNTRLVDGSGPDILVMDDMPMDSYIDKGILMDISDVANQVDSKEGLFMNLLMPFYENDSLYVIPAEMQLPVIAENDDKQMDYKALSDKVTQLRSEYPEKDILEVYSARDVLRRFSLVCAPAWKNENQTLNEEKIREFLTESKRIYEAQMSGEESKKKQNEKMETKDIESKKLEESMYYFVINDASYLTQRAQLLYGTLITIDEFAKAMSVQKNEGFEDTKISPMNGQSSHVYIPRTMAGINAATKNKQEAEKFLQTLIGSDVQELLFTGFPINKKAFKESTVLDSNIGSEDGAYMMYGMIDGEGNSFTWEVYWPTDEQMQMLEEWIASTDTPYISDKVLEDAIFTFGAEYLDGVIDIDIAMRQIMEKIEIYLAE